LRAREKRPGKPKAKEGEDWYIGPRIGLSFFTGIVGAELQSGHIALDVMSKESGIDTLSGIDIGGGIKYYGHPWKSANWFGVGGLKGSYRHYSEDSEITILGFMAGYRWRSGGGWDFSLGGGFGQYTRRFTNDWRKGEEEVYLVPMIEIAFGYSF
jgi:hypothetical protein